MMPQMPYAIRCLILTGLVLIGLNFVGALNAGALASSNTSSSQNSPTILVSKVWSRATPGAASTAAVYLTLMNNGQEADQLLSIETDIAKKAALHSMDMKGSIMEMRGMDEPLTIAAGSKVLLAPGALHIMLEEIKKPLVAGDKFFLSLRFAKAGLVKTSVEVEPLGSKGLE
jgi:copper(I)-binding protein